MSVKFKESTQWYKFFYVATAIATVVYSKNMTKNTDYFKHIVPVKSKLQHPPPGNPQAFVLFAKFLFKFPPPEAEKLFKCPIIGPFQVIKCPHPREPFR